MRNEYDAIIIGSGPNGFAAAIYLQQQGLSTIIFEQSKNLGGAAQTEDGLLEGYRHDRCSAIHPLAYDSPFFKILPLREHGLNWIHPEIPFAHPFPEGTSFACYRNIDETASQLAGDQTKYSRLFSKLLNDWQVISREILGPLKMPRHPIKMARFGYKALLSAKLFAKWFFEDEKTRMLFYGASAHSVLPLNYPASASFGLVLSLLAHSTGWPFPEGGAGKITAALSSLYLSLGGEVARGFPVRDIKELPRAKAYLFDVTPGQLLKIGGIDLPGLYRKQLSAYKYGAGVFKMDWALSEPVPFVDEKCRKAGTVHIGYSTAEIEESEALIYRNRVSSRPFIILAQPSLFDASRAPNGKHTAWAYCHVPNGSQLDMADAIEKQMERAAPGFRDCIIYRSARNTAMMEQLNPNLVGGDINGGMQDISQLFARPVFRLSPYSTPNPKIYICSSSSPPGGGVHGMCGYHAAAKAFKDHFRG